MVWAWELLFSRSGRHDPFHAPRFAGGAAAPDPLQPADRAAEGTVAYSEDLSHHGSILATTQVKRLITECDMKSCTFAYCRLGAPYQKYTTILYTPELSSVLDGLNSSDFQCNHPTGFHGGVQP